MKTSPYENNYKTLIFKAAFKRLKTIKTGRTTRIKLGKENTPLYVYKDIDNTEYILSESPRLLPQIDLYIHDLPAYIVPKQLTLNI